MKKGKFVAYLLALVVTLTSCEKKKKLILMICCVQK